VLDLPNPARSRALSGCLKGNPDHAITLGQEFLVACHTRTAAMGGISGSAPDEVGGTDPGIVRFARVRGCEVDDLRDGAAAG
jgi:hypothetical protein